MGTLQEKDGIRVSETGASRNSALGKLEYSNYIHPLADLSFAEYMKSHQVINGEYRRGDNRQKGLGEDSLFEGLVRHVEALKLLKKGYHVVERQEDGKTYVGTFSNLAEYFEHVKKLEDSGISYHKKNIVEQLNAIRFNGEALKLYELGLYN